MCHPLPADVGYHSLKPTYAEQTICQDKCEYLDGNACYYDGSSLQAKILYWQFVEHGEVAVWEELERRYWNMVHSATSQSGKPE